MSFSAIRSTLVQMYNAVNLGLSTAFENAKFDVPANAGWAAVYILPNQPRVAELGAGGSDEHTGVMQIDLNFPLGNGESDILSKADSIAGYFTAGRRLTYNAQEVIVLSCGRSRGRQVDGWFRISLTIDWLAYTPRP